MPSRNIEKQIEALGLLLSCEITNEAQTLVRKAMGDPVGLVVAKAAAVVAHHRLQALLPDLLAAYGKLFEGGSKRDPQCWAKTAIAKALKELDYSDSAPFLRGLSYRQWEPVWGQEVDTAGSLRAHCVLAMGQCVDLMRGEKLWHLMRTLSDAEPPVRLEAVRALEEIDGMEAALLLRLKARMGDKESSITGQALQSLLAIEGDSAIPFVSEFLDQKGWPDRNEEVQEQAALALGASRIPGAIDLLISMCKNGRFKTVLLQAISTSRQPAALEFLLLLVSSARLEGALAALDALSLYRGSPAISAEVEGAVAARQNAELQARFAQRFGLKQPS